MNTKQRLETISAYGSVLENCKTSVGRESDLPYPKELIRQALSDELLNPCCPQILNAVEVGFFELEAFLPEEEYSLVAEFERKVVSLAETMKPGDPESIRQAAAQMGETPAETLEIQKKVNQRKHERLKQIQNMRQLRGRS